jgi:alanine racemase
MSHAPHLNISLSRIAQNWQALQARSQAECAGVVKADGYGLGGVEVTAALRQAGCKTFFVAHLNEAIALRHAFQDIKIYVLNGLPLGSVQDYLQDNLTPVLGSREELQEWGNVAPFALMVDTGMNRLGLALEEAQGGFNPAFIMSHFACSDAPAHPLNTLQMQRFEAIRARFPQAKASLANSDGIAFKAAHYDLLRPGIALYHDAVTLEACVIQSRLVKRGESVGYSATFIAPEDMPVALVSLGYADGFMRQSQAKEGQGGEALYNGKRVKIIGRVSMDILAVACAAKRGESLTFLGNGLSQQEVATSMNTISYELLTRLGQRFERTYR